MRKSPPPCGEPSMTNSDRPSGVRRPFLDGDISWDGPLSWETRGLGVVFRDGGFVALVLGNNESPPEGTVGDIVSRYLFYFLLLLLKGCWRREPCVVDYTRFEVTEPQAIDCHFSSSSLRFFFLDLREPCYPSPFDSRW